MTIQCERYSYSLQSDRRQLRGVPAQFRRQGESHILINQFDLFQRTKTLLLEEGDQIAHKILRRGGSSRYGNAVDAFQPLGVDLSSVVNQERTDTRIFSH